MNRNNTTTKSSANKATGGSLLLGLLSIAGMAIAKRLIDRAQQVQPPITSVGDGSNSNPPTEPHPSGAHNAGVGYLNQTLAIDEQRVEETRRYLGDDAAATLDRANKEEYARMLRDMQRDSNEGMREIARNLGR